MEICECDFFFSLFLVKFLGVVVYERGFIFLTVNAPQKPTIQRSKVNRLSNQQRLQVHRVKLERLVNNIWVDCPLTNSTQSRQKRRKRGSMKKKTSTSSIIVALKWTNRWSNKNLMLGDELSWNRVSTRTIRPQTHIEIIFAIIMIDMVAAHFLPSKYKTRTAIYSECLPKSSKFQYSRNNWNFQTQQ